MKKSQIIGRVMASAGGLGTWSYVAYHWHLPFLYLVAFLAIIVPWVKPTPPLPKIGDYEDD